MDKATLRQYRAIIEEIADLELEKQHVLDNYLAPPPLTGMPAAHGNNDRIGNVVARRDKYQQLINAKLDELIVLRADIEAAISGLPADERRIIRAHYVDGKTWEQIAVDMHYSIYRIWHKHGEILARMKDSRS